MGCVFALALSLSLSLSVFMYNWAGLHAAQNKLELLMGDEERDRRALHTGQPGGGGPGPGVRPPVVRHPLTTGLIWLHGLSHSLFWNIRGIFHISSGLSTPYPHLMWQMRFSPVEMAQVLMKSVKRVGLVVVWSGWKMR